jgi:hypothetical protein
MNKKACLLRLLMLMYFGSISCSRKAMKENMLIRMSIADLNQNLALYEDSFVAVSGFLTNRGENYYKDLQPFLEDTLGRAIPVTVWHPIEIPPMQNPSIPRPKVMRDYLNIYIELTGYLRQGAVEDNYYLDVKEGKVLQEK